MGLALTLLRALVDGLRILGRETQKGPCGKISVSILLGSHHIRILGICGLDYLHGERGQARWKLGICIELNLGEVFSSDDSRGYPTSQLGVFLGLFLVSVLK